MGRIEFIGVIKKNPLNLFTLTKEISADSQFTMTVIII